MQQNHPQPIRNWGLVKQILDGNGLDSVLAKLPPGPLLVLHLCSATIAFSLSMLAPVRSATFSLFFKKIKVGIAVTLYSSAMSSHSSTSTLRKTTSCMVLSISSKWGAIILQGPHHVAWKSTTTSFPPAATSWVSKSALFSTACTIFS